jgi:hypothetical protein
MFAFECHVGVIMHCQAAHSKIPALQSHLNVDAPNDCVVLAVVKFVEIYVAPRQCIPQREGATLTTTEGPWISRIRHRRVGGFNA